MYPVSRFWVLVSWLECRNGPSQRMAHFPGFFNRKDCEDAVDFGLIRTSKLGAERLLIMAEFCPVHSAIHGPARSSCCRVSKDNPKMAATSSGIMGLPFRSMYWIIYSPSEGSQSPKRTCSATNERKAASWPLPSKPACSAHPNKMHNPRIFLPFIFENPCANSTAKAPENLNA